MKILSVLVFSFCFSMLEASNKVDWTVCKKEIAESCAKVKDDHETHECLEKLSSAKISKSCKKMNSGLEAVFSNKHNDNHKH